MKALVEDDRDAADERRTRDRLRASTAALLLSICIALLLGALWTAPGSAAVSLAARTAYQAARPIGWILAWCSWMICAAMLVTFLFAASKATENRRADLALMLGVVGTSIDVLCQLLQLTLMPKLAAGMPESESLFLAFDELCVSGSVMLGPALYTAGIPLLTASLPRPGVGLHALTGCAVVAGLTLIASGTAGDANWMAGTMVFQLITYSLWAIGFVRNAERRSRPSVAALASHRPFATQQP